MLNSLEAHAGHGKIPCRLRQNLLADTPESPAGHAGTTCLTRQNHLPDTPKSPAGYARTTWLTLQITFRAYQHNVSEVPEAHAGQAGTISCTDRKHRKHSPEPPACLTGPTAGHGKSPAGYARATWRTLWNHLPGMPEPPLRHARTMCLRCRNHTPNRPKLPARPA